MRESLQMLQFIGFSLAGLVVIGVIVYFAGGYYRDFSQDPPPEPEQPSRIRFSPGAPKIRF